MKTGIFFLSLFACLLPAHAQHITFAVSTGSAMPMTEFRNDMLASGLLKDFGDALAQELALEARYLSLPRKRVESAISSGQADLLCDMRPEWMDNKEWVWTDVVFSNNMIIVSRADTDPLGRLPDLAGERVGTVLGYRYPEVEKRLGPLFKRDDAATDDINTSKLLTGRFNYMMSNSLYYDYQRKIHQRRDLLNAAVFTIRPFDTYCALPKQGRLDIGRVNRAIATLRKRGDMQAIHDRYRPAR